MSPHGGLAGERQIADRLVALTSWLREHRPLWRVRPFVDQAVPWAGDYPALESWLLSRSSEEVARIEAGDAISGQPALFTTLLEQKQRLIGVCDGVGSGVDPAGRMPSVRLRKSAQIAALTKLSAPLVDGPGLEHVIDWCSGKGHLGRSIGAVTDTGLILVERDAALCKDGERLAAEAGLACRVLNLDVLKEDMSLSLPSRGLLVGLHACGSLGERLLNVAVDTAQSSVVYAPCCYHRGYMEGPYTPLSTRARDLELGLIWSDLRLPTLDEAVASPRKRVRRHREQAWRLAVDALVREATGRDVYTPLGPAPKAWLAGSFGEFARRLTSRAALPLPTTWSADAAQALGWQRAKSARALGALRSVFRRPLELWLVLDRALYLSERGYSVDVVRFCEARITPRNLVIIASRR